MYRIIIALICLLSGIGLGFILGSKSGKKKALQIIQSKNAALQKNVFLYNVCSAWMLLQEMRVDITEFFRINKLERIAVYGMGKIGQTLVEALKDTEYEVKYAVDKTPIAYEIPVYRPEEKLPEADILIVTVWEYEQVKSTVSVNESCKIVSIKDILDVILDLQ